jgi:hypothetical protein
MRQRRIRRMSWIVFAPLAGAVTLASFTAPASAQKGKTNKDASAAADVPSAKELYTSAQKLFDRGKYAEALVAFRQAHNASSSPNARLMIGHCLVALGKTGEAYEEMSATMREAAKRAESEPKYVPTRDAAATQVALLETKVGKLILEVSDRSSVEVTINGSRVSPEKLGVPLAVDPGTAVIAATRSDGRSMRREQVVKAGETERIALTFQEATKDGAAAISGGVGPVKPAPGGEPTEPPGDKATQSGGGVRIAGFFIAGIGVAGMAVFGVTGMMARSRFATLEEECGGKRCSDPKYADVVDSGMTLTTVANIGLIAGAAGIAGGGLMILLGGASKAADPQPSAALSIAPSPSMRGARLHYTVTF